MVPVVIAVAEEVGGERRPNVRVSGVGGRLGCGPFVNPLGSLSLSKLRISNCFV